MNLAAAMPRFFQVSAALGLFLALYIMLGNVRRTTLSDKYGIGWFVLLCALSWINLKANWFAILSLEAGALILTGSMTAIYVGISFSVRITEYSRVRRASIQEVALLRYRYEELYKKTQTQDPSQTVQTV